MKVSLMRLAYKLVHNSRLQYWRVRRPSTSGALLLIRNGGEILVLRSTYRKALALPGGYINPNEPPKDAALRELREELGVEVDATAIVDLGRHTFDYEYRQDTCHLFLVDVDKRPAFEANGYEIAWAGWMTMDAIAREALVVPHLRAFARGELPAR